MKTRNALALQQTVQQWLSQGTAAVLIEVVRIKGSTPRNVGARMVVSADEVLGTVGGGHLEWRAIALARQALAECRQTGPQTLPAPWQQDFALGPSLGQCCGGALTLAFTPLSAALVSSWPTPPSRFHLDLHGAGHVGQAIIQILGGLDCTVRWIDERAAPDDLTSYAQAGLPDTATLASLPPHIQWLPTDQAEAEVQDAPAGACHLVLTHRHDLDLRIVRAILQRGDAGFVGLIGSQTKRAQFRRRLAEQDLSPEQIETMTCPIGLDGIEGKEPMVIAVSAVAQLLRLTPLQGP
ncbi:MAG: xanthine dehydrogenase accessory protein XdhC [Burkholderiales bacterium]|nr:xanthine dehydrogenase accessory protein XdhC [Burkholderiales bacterium]